MILFGLIVLLPSPIQRVAADVQPANTSTEQVASKESTLTPKQEIAAPQPRQFNANDRSTWPVCASDEFVRADTGKCAKKPAQQAVVAQAAKPAAAVSGTCGLASKYDWPVATAKAVCMAESSGNPSRANWQDNHGKCVGSFGLMQIGCFWFPYFGYNSSHYYNGEVGMEIAYKIWQRQGGFGAWSAYNNGAYYKYL